MNTHLAPLNSCLQAPSNLTSCFSLLAPFFTFWAERVAISEQMLVKSYAVQRFAIDGVQDTSANGTASFHFASA
jgi:hypothetical protein